MLWFIHHSVFQFVSRVPRLMSFFNKWSLLFIGLMPFGFRLLKVYSIDTEYEKESHVIQVNCVIIFCASMSQLFMWLSVHWKRDKHLLAHHKGLNYGITLCKLLVYPIISAILFGFAFSSIKITIEYVAIIQLGVLVIHFLIKIVYEIIFKCCVGDIQSDNEDTSEIDDELMALDSLPRIASKSKRTETLKAGVFLNNSTDDTHM
uniref:Transmembrane protein 175-like n=1 Tax=Saccoglossus kowalevskii TaxID=10224 RepID=A0ABM0MHZ3_SACKO|nr:PREDICTED: transmembrane protein 175-like [Saccoglossus kowalevskii]